MAWSYSSWSLYKKCPLAYKLRYIDKIPGPKPGPALDRGNRIHKNLELFLKGETSAHEAPGMGEKVVELRSKPALKVEAPWGFTKKWIPTGWTSRDTWCRMKLDASYSTPDQVIVVDFKTGREYPEHKYQASLYLVGAITHWPEHKRFECQMWYLDRGFMRTYPKDRTLVKNERRWWKQAGKALQADTQYAPTPSRTSCRWCDYRSDKLNIQRQPGPCELWRGT